MFNPSRDEVRRFFCEAWRKRLQGSPVEAAEARAIDCIALHPEYHPLLADPERALAQDYPVEAGATNPFLHLSLHLALEEQLAIGQPPGILAAMRALQARAPDRHAALHEALECLGETMWRVQRGTLGPDTGQINAAYLDCLRRRAG